jgi:predicted peptidase
MLKTTVLFILIYGAISVLSVALADTSSTQIRPLDAKQHKQWLQDNLDKVLVKHRYVASNNLNMPYRLFLPPNYDEAKAYPLLVFLHGRGERGDDNTTKMFANVGLFSGEQSIVSPNGQAEFNSIVLVPQCSAKSPDQEWAHWVGNSPEQPFEGLGKDGSYQQHKVPSDSGLAALELIDATIKNYAIDRSRVYITGISMGGFGTWEFISRRPELFAAAVPMAGFSDPNTLAAIGDIPLWIFHGDADEYNPVEGSRTMYTRLKLNGVEVRYSEYEGANHSESFKLAWQNREILPWMFSKRKNETNKKGKGKDLIRLN